MSYVYLHPDATISNTTTIVPSGTAHGVLSDSTPGGDATYVSFASGQSVELSFGELTLPFGSMIHSVGCYVQSWTTVPSPPPLLSGDLTVGSLVHTETLPVTWTTETGHERLVTVYQSSGSLLTDAQVEGAWVRLWSPSGSISVRRAYLAVIYIAPAVVNIVSPTGTLIDTTQPTITWTTSLDTSGGPQTHFEVQILDASEDVVADSGVVSSELTNWESPTLAQGTYEARVRIAQTVASNRHWSGWATQAFTIDTPTPATPILTLTPQASEGRIRIELEDPGGGDVTTTSFHVERSPDNATWEPLRSGLMIPDAGLATVYDYDAPNGGLVYYRAWAAHWYVTAGVTTFANSDYAKDADMWSSDEWWLKHPTRPSLNLNPVLKSQPGRQSAIAQGVFHPLGRRLPVVVSDVRQSWTGEVAFRLATDAERAALDAILADGRPLLLQGPTTVYWNETWIAVSAHDRTRPIDQSWGAYTFDTLTWTEVERPLDELEE